MLTPSMKYSVKALSSVILAFPAKILNSAIYSLMVPFPCRNCLSFALASPSLLANSKDSCSRFMKARYVLKDGGVVAWTSEVNASFQA